MAKPLFAYGTLLHPEVLRRIVPKAELGEPGEVEGLRASRLTDRSYPGAFWQEGASTRGRLVDVAGTVHGKQPHSPLDAAEHERLTALAYAALDAYEGDDYERAECTVLLARGGSVSACVYLLRRESWGLLSPVTWDPQAFLGACADEYLQEYFALQARESKQRES